MGKVDSCHGLFSDMYLVFFIAVCSIGSCYSVNADQMGFAQAHAVIRKLTLLPPVCRNSMLRVDAKQSAPKDGRSPLENFEVSL